jgi:hypothetical protein
MEAWNSLEREKKRRKKKKWKKEKKEMKRKKRKIEREKVIYLFNTVSNYTLSIFHKQKLNEHTTDIITIV